MSEDNASAILEVLFRIERTLADIRDISRSQQHSGKTLSKNDREQLERLLPGIVAILGDGTFTVADLIADAVDYDDLRLALERSFGLDWRKRARTIGKLLARSDGATVGDFCLTKNGEVREGVLWRVSILR